MVFSGGLLCFLVGFWSVFSGFWLFVMVFSIDLAVCWWLFGGWERVSAKDYLDCFQPKINKIQHYLAWLEDLRIRRKKHFSDENILKCFKALKCPIGPRDATIPLRTNLGDPFSWIQMKPMPRGFEGVSCWEVFEYLKVGFQKAGSFVTPGPLYFIHPLQPSNGCQFSDLILTWLTDSESIMFLGQRNAFRKWS